MYITPCCFDADTLGATAFHVAAAHAPGDVPQNLGAIHNKTYEYHAETADGLQFEDGFGAWDDTAHTIARTTIVNNSDNSVLAIAFTDYPLVYVFPAPPPALEPTVIAEVPSGSVMLFYQAAAPTGWTKSTAHNDCALRVVSGTGGGNGGSVAFSTVFGRVQTDSHVLTEAELAPHTHGYEDSYPDGGGSLILSTGTIYGVNDHSRSTSSAGSGQGHVHGIEMRVTYVDVIICTKD